MKPEIRVLFCECAHAGVVSQQAKEDVRRALDGSGLPCTVVPDLCELAARQSPVLMEAAGARTLAIAACYPRAVRWLFAAGAAPLRDEAVVYLDMRGGCREDLAASVRALRESTAAGGEVATALTVTAGTPAWQPWFPVIDRERCENCQQCLNFCLFGVYTAGSEGSVQVSHPANCKNGCPACARVCPSAAIVFPKYPNAPINGGELKPGEAPEPLQIDKAALLGGDTLKILQDRGKHALAFARESDELRALQERWRHVGAGRPLPLLRREPSDQSPKERS